MILKIRISTFVKFSERKLQIGAVVDLLFFADRDPF